MGYMAGSIRRPQQPRIAEYLYLSQLIKKISVIQKCAARDL